MWSPFTVWWFLVTRYRCIPAEVVLAAQQQVAVGLPPETVEPNLRQRVQTARCLYGDATRANLAPELNAQLVGRIMSS